MRKKEKLTLAQVMDGISKSMFKMLEAYHQQQCLKCPHNPDMKVKKDGPEL